MKLRFIQAFSDGRASFQAGKVYEVDNADAVRLVNAGVANKAPEPVEVERTEPKQSPLLKEHEKAGALADKSLPLADAVAQPKAPPPSNNPAAFLHGDGTVEPHTGFTTTEPDAKTSPPSDGKSPLASHTAPEAIGTATTGSPTGASDAAAAKAEEPKFAGHSLGEFDGKSDQEILAVKGVGDSTLKTIRDAQAKRDAAAAK